MDRLWICIIPKTKRGFFIVGCFEQILILKRLIKIKTHYFGNEINFNWNFFVVVVCTLLPGKLGVTGSTPEAGVFFRLQVKVLFVLNPQNEWFWWTQISVTEIVSRLSFRNPRFTRFINAYNTEDSVDMNGGCRFDICIHHVRVRVARPAGRRTGRAGEHGDCDESAWQDARLPLLPRPVQNYRRRVMDAKLGYVDVPMGFSHLCIIRLPANPLKVPIPIIKINCFHRPSAINQNLVRPVSVFSPVLVQTVRSQLVDGVASLVMQITGCERNKRKLTIRNIAKLIQHNKNIRYFSINDINHIILFVIFILY